jgi:hypothetical protein
VSCHGAEHAGTFLAECSSLFLVEKGFELVAKPGRDAATNAGK